MDLLESVLNKASENMRDAVEKAKTGDKARYAHHETQRGP